MAPEIHASHPWLPLTDQFVPTVTDSSKHPGVHWEPHVRGKVILVWKNKLLFIVTPYFHDGFSFSLSLPHFEQDLQAVYRISLIFHSLWDNNTSFQ